MDKGRDWLKRVDSIDGTTQCSSTVDFLIFFRNRHAVFKHLRLLGLVQVVIWPTSWDLNGSMLPILGLLRHPGSSNTYISYDLIPLGQTGFMENTLFRLSEVSHCLKLLSTWCLPRKFSASPSFHHYDSRDLANV